MSKSKLAKHIGSSSAATMLSRLLGLVRDQIFAYFFGISYVADAFNFAFTIPNLLRRLFGEGALSAAFIPIYQEIGVNKSKKEQISFAINVLSLLTLFLTFLCIIGILFTPLIVKLLATTIPSLFLKLFGSSNQIFPGLDSKTFILTVKLTRILFPYLFLIGISSTLISILNSHNYFFIPGLSSAFFNIGMIGILGGYAILFPSDKEVYIVVLSLGVLFGGVLQTIVNFPYLKKCGYYFGISFNLGGKALKDLWFRFIPGVWGIAIRQVNLLADRALASMLISGSISALNYGNRLMQLPLGIFGAAVSTAAIPHFSRYAAKKDWSNLSSKLKFSLTVLSYILIPTTILIFILGEDFIRIIFMRGQFNLLALKMSYNALVYYSVGLLFYGINRTLIPVFYARKNTKTPVIISTIIVLVNLILNIILMRFLYHSGLALATSISSLVQFILLLIIMNRMYPEIDFKQSFKHIFITIIISIVTGCGFYFINIFLQTTNLLILIFKSIFFSSIYFLFVFYFCYLLKLPYLSEIKKDLWTKLQKKLRKS